MALGRSQINTLEFSLKLEEVSLGKIETEFKFSNPFNSLVLLFRIKLLNGLLKELGI
jgi:hypothetical protein